VRASPPRNRERANAFRSARGRCPNGSGRHCAGKRRTAASVPPPYGKLPLAAVRRSVPRRSTGAAFISIGCDTVGRRRISARPRGASRSLGAALHRRRRAQDENGSDRPPASSYLSHLPLAACDIQRRAHVARLTKRLGELASRGGGQSADCAIASGGRHERMRRSDLRDPHRRREACE